MQKGIASVEGIDAAMKLGANHPIGPLAFRRFNLDLMFVLL